MAVNIAILAPDSQLGCIHCETQLWRLLTTGQIACASCNALGHPVSWVPKPPIADSEAAATCRHRIFRLPFDGSIVCADAECAQVLRARRLLEGAPPCTPAR